MGVSLPALAQRVMVFGSTRNIVATCAGVSRGPLSALRRGILAAECRRRDPGVMLVAEGGS
jgi:hypothetical protein